MIATERLEAALSQLEALNEQFEPSLREFEDSDHDYENEYRRMRAKAEGTVQDRDNQAEQHCADVGLDTRRRIAKVRLEAIKFKSRNITTIVDGLRSQIASERAIT